MQFHGHAEKVEDRAKDQIEYCNEDKWVREKFEGEMAKRLERQFDGAFYYYMIMETKHRNVHSPMPGQPLPPIGKMPPGAT
jgi:hypothetical protein